jgi:opacity protein-like surface antigen
MLKKTLLAAAVFACATTAVQANEVSGYLTGSVGQSDTKGANTDTAYKIAVGLQANQYVGLEAQYTDLGKPSDRGYLVVGSTAYSGKLTADTKGLGANLVGTLPLDDFKLFAKVGYHKMETKVKFKADAGGSVSGTAREWVPSFGAGASYAIMPELEIVAEYERYKDVADAYNVDLASVGLRYNF